jgi:glycosyltransferase involved in cell wall biosynthesis
MKIAIVVTGGLHPSGEREVVPSWLALFERLAKLHELHAFTLRHLQTPQTYSLRGFTVHDLGRPSAPLGFTRWAQERALGRALDQVGPFDLIHGFWADPAGQLAARAGRRRHIPSVVTCDSGEFVSIPKIKYGSQRTIRGRRAVREACELATRVHVCSSFMSALAHTRGVTATVIPLTSVTSQAATLKSAFSRRGESPFRIIQIASLSPVKNQRLLIDAFRMVLDQIDAHLDLVGEDTMSGQLQNYVATLGMADRVTFHGFLPQDRVLALLSEADLYVQSSLHEAAGVAVLEAAAAGVPTVGTLTGYVADWGRSKAVALGDAIPESLADAILTLHADPDRRRSIAAAARTFAIAHDAAFAASRFDQLYRMLVADSGAVDRT